MKNAFPLFFLPVEKTVVTVGRKSSGDGMLFLAGGEEVVGRCLPGELFFLCSIYQLFL